MLRQTRKIRFGKARPEKPRRVSSPSFWRRRRRASICAPPTTPISIADAAVARERARANGAVHPRVSIWGPFEARLQQPDILILGSLNEGTWPEAAEPGAWLNRPMRRDLGLPSPEEEIGRAAHDFVSLLGAKTVYLTRAGKVDGVPTVPSRWLMRLTALLKGMKLAERSRSPISRGSPGRARATGSSITLKIEAPAPTPAVELRPRKLSVTRNRALDCPTPTRSSPAAS